MHALAIHVYTEDEWRQRFNQAPMSPPCAGGEKSGGSASI
jgi:BolA protein